MSTALSIIRKYIKAFNFSFCKNCRQSIKNTNANAAKRISFVVDIVSREFDEFKKEQLQNSKEEIFENAYKISTLSDFVDMCDPECGCLKINEVKALIKEKYPAHTLYNFYMKSDAGGINDLYESIWYRLNDLADRNNTNKTKDNFER